MSSPKCPICKQYVERLLHSFVGEGELAVVAKMERRNPWWSIYQGLCERCLYLNEFDSLSGHFLPDPGFSDSKTSGETAVKSTLFRSRVKNEFALLPTHLRLNADPRFTGKGITIAFIDSGFFPHPDLTKPKNRIRKILDVTAEQRTSRYFRSAHPESWHGTMTSVAAAGNGWLSKGLYRGIAPEADVVLIKAMNAAERAIGREDILRGLHWAIDNAPKYNIRIISISVYDDDAGTLINSPVDQAVEEAVASGLVVVAAVGNNPSKPVLPPASSPSAITVGGVNDQNAIWKHYRTMFHSTYGRTLDGYAKPELIAPAIWVAGPILPKTDQFNEAPVLFALLQATPAAAARLLTKHAADLPEDARGVAKGDYKNWARERIAAMKYVGPHYKHVDGTSFAAPIVSSVIAQMLEANPDLTPAEVKQILMDTAEPLADAAEEQQGKGVLAPRAALEAALRKRHLRFPSGVHEVDGRLLFVYHNRVPRSVALAGSFNGWDAKTLRLHESKDGWWSILLPKPASGEYHYKYVIDGAVWLEDPANKDRAPDGLGGWNSRVVVN